MKRYINNIGYDGKLWLLLREDATQGVYEGQTVRSFRGEPAVITGGRPPHKAGSTGKVWTEEGGAEAPASSACAGSTRKARAGASAPA